jgi:uncharacterized membrane protein
VARFSRSTHIDAPPQRVFAFFTDPAHLKDLDHRIQTVTIDEEGGQPRTVHFVILPTPGGAPVPVDARVTAYEPGRSMAVQSLRSAKGPSISLRYTCAPSGAGTDLACDVQLALPGPLGKLADPLVGRQLEIRASEALERAKRALESQGSTAEPNHLAPEM